MIGIINYGSGNIRAIANILEKLSHQYIVVEKKKDMNGLSKIILPGVGSFDGTMDRLCSSGLKESLDEAVLQNFIPVLGICVGFQIMADSSEEGKSNGLGWIPGKVKRFQEDWFPSPPKVPHLGWNSIEVERQSDLLEGVDPQRGFYFLHSYYFVPDDPSAILASSQYAIKFCCAAQNGRIFGCQFHPEKSHGNGISIFRNFIENC